MASAVARSASELSTASTLVVHHELLITPYPELVMTLALIPSPSSTADGTCTITLTHPGTTDQYLAFKVKTRQPRRYLVRPNQGLLAPQASGKVVITMVEQEKKRFLQSYNPMGRPSALKNVFLIESYAVAREFSASYLQFKEMENHAKMKSLLTSMWKSVSGSKLVLHQKLRVRHKVVVGEELDRIEQAIKETTLNNNNTNHLQIPADVVLRRRNPEAPVGDSSVASSQQVASTKLQWARRLSPFRMFRRHHRHDDCKSWTSIRDTEPTSTATAQQLSSLQEKYDQLVTYSKQLEVERDMLKNQLEQAHRDLMREKGLVV